MITTNDTKQQQLQKGYYETGTGRKQILILGSCRTVPYLTYLRRWNDHNNDQFTIRRIDPCDWAVDGIAINSLETDERILSVLRSCDYFIHEYLINYGMFNTDKTADKNIYQFGIKDPIDTSFPNWNDHMILEKDYEAYGSTAPDNYQEIGEAQVEKFCSHAELSSFPEFADYFRDKWREIRFFWRPNHVSTAFTMYVFRRLNSKFLNLTLSEDFINTCALEDLFKDPHTNVTQRDRDGYHLLW